MTSLPDAYCLTPIRSSIRVLTSMSCACSATFRGQSTLGFLYTDREYHGAYNRVGGVDGRFKLNANWVATFQAVTSSTGFDDKTTAGGPAYYAQVKRSGRNFNYTGTFTDTSVGFLTEVGFFFRPDYRNTSHNFSYTFHPAHSILLSHGLYVSFTRAYDHQGVSLNQPRTVTTIGNSRVKTISNSEARSATRDFGPLISHRSPPTSNTTSAKSTATTRLTISPSFGFHILAAHDNFPSYVTAGAPMRRPLGQPPRPRA